MNTVEKIKSIVTSNRVWAIDNRCHQTCIDVYNKLPKAMKKDVTMIEGRVDGMLHYWLSVDGVVVDPHYMIIDQDDAAEAEYSYEPSKSIDPESAHKHEGFFLHRMGSNFKGDYKMRKYSPYQMMD